MIKYLIATTTLSILLSSCIKQKKTIKQLKPYMNNPIAILYSDTAIYGKEACASIFIKSGKYQIVSGIFKCNFDSMYFVKDSFVYCRTSLGFMFMENDTGFICMVPMGYGERCSDRVNILFKDSLEQLYSLDTLVCFDVENPPYK